MPEDITVSRKGLGVSYGRRTLNINEQKKRSPRSRWHWTQATQNGRVRRMTMMAEIPLDSPFQD